MIESEPIVMSQYLTDHGSPNAILSFGAPHRPGGAYVVGQTAQEEDLCCRIPQLYLSLTPHQELYSRVEGLGDTTALLSEDLVVTRDREYAPIEDVGASVNVITAAMPNIRGRDQPQIRSPQT